MVSLDAIRSSNSRIADVLPSGLVAVFVGATNGIGETTLLQFAKHTTRPKVYFIGRSQEAGDRILTECRRSNPEGQFEFIKADTSLIRNVDTVCEDIKKKERHINLLFLSTGTLDFVTITSEGIPLAGALAHYTRARFILNLLPLLRTAPSLRRVVSVLTGTKEGPIFELDFHRSSVPLLSARGHMSSIVTFSLEAIAKRAPDVSFIHEYPGPVKSGIGREVNGVIMGFMIAVWTLLGPFINVPLVESGERHLMLATSAMYPAREGQADGVPVDGDANVARGINGEVGSGVYSIDQNGESAGKNVEEFLAGMRENGMVEKVEKQMEEEFKRILGDS